MSAGGGYDSSLRQQRHRTLHRQRAWPWGRWSRAAFQTLGTCAAHFSRWSRMGVEGQNAHLFVIFVIAQTTPEQLFDRGSGRGRKISRPVDRDVLHNSSCSRSNHSPSPQASIAIESPVPITLSAN